MTEAQATIKSNNLTPDVLEAASILVAMKRGMRYFLLEAQQARHHLSYLDFAALNPGSAQVHFLAGHRIPFSPLYDITPMPAAYHFPLAQPVAYYGMLASPSCYVGLSRERGASTEGVVDSEITQSAPKRMRLSTISTSSPEGAANDKQESKRKRKNYTKEQLEILENAYAEMKYPHIEERLKLEKVTKLTEDRIQVWFQNRRAKDRKRTEPEKCQRYFENTQKLTGESQKNGAGERSPSESPIQGAQIKQRQNSGSDTSDNASGEFDNFPFSGSQTE